MAMKEPYFEKILRRLRLRKLENYICDDDILLDVGCGWQALALQFFAHKLSKGIGIDFKVENVELPNNIKTFQIHFEQLPWPIADNTANKVTMLAVLEHIDPMKLDAIFAGIRGAMRKDGKLLITVPTPTAKPVLEFLAYKLGIVNSHEIRDHKKYYDYENLSKLLDKQGFAIEKYRTFQLGFNSFCIAVRK